METLTKVQAYHLIDLAANDNRLYHYNGGQAYMKIHEALNVLMVIDHTIQNVKVDLYDGTEYFISCAGYNWEYSRKIREHGSLAQWYMDTYKVDA